MTPEELNGTIEFIVQHQAKISANLDQISDDFQKDGEERMKFDKTAQTLMAQLAANAQRMADLLVIHSELLRIQSSRLDRAEAEE